MLVLFSKSGRPLMKFAIHLIKHILLLFDLKTSALVVDAGIQNNVSELRRIKNMILITSIIEMDHISKIIKAHQNLGLLVKGVTKIFENKIQTQISGFFGKLPNNLGAILCEKCW